ncbi:hypothetical protein Tco_0225732, partial [Tanacetum coccineum]
DTNVHGDEGTNSLRLSFVDQSGRNLNTVQNEVFQSSLGDYFVHLSPTDMRMTSLTRSVMLRKGSHLGTQLVMCPNGSFIGGALAQANMLKRFKNLEADYGKLAETHAECKEIVRKLVDARFALEHNLRLYLDMSERFKKVKDEHSGCTVRLQMLEGQNSELSQVNKD